MISFSRKDDAFNVVYHSSNFDSGLTITMDVIDNTDSSISGSPFTMSEIGSTGLYSASFTPVTIGTFKIIVEEEGIKRAASTVEVMNYSLDSLGTIVDGIVPASGSDGGFSP